MFTGRQARNLLLGQTSGHHHGMQDASLSDSYNNSEWPHVDERNPSGNHWQKPLDPVGCCGNVLDVENRTRCTSVNWDRALSSLLFALKAKINYEASALSCYVNGRCTCTGRTCMPTAIVRGVAGNSWNGPFRASAYPLACKITFPPLRHTIRFFPVPRTSSSFRYYTATINPQWAYRRIGRADCFICIISIENNPLLSWHIHIRARVPSLSNEFLCRPFFCITYRSLRNCERQQVIFCWIAWPHNAGNKPHIVRWIAYVKCWWSNKKRSAVQSF